MKFLTAGFFCAVLYYFLAPVTVNAISINERAGNHFRTASNNQESILNKSNVNAAQFGLIHPNGHNFDAKVEAQPLVIEKGANGDDLVIITTMKNEVIGINARTNARLYTIPLGPAIDTRMRNPDGTFETDENGKPLQDMDMWKHTPDWGISATPIFDPDSNTLFVAAWVQNPDNDHRDYKVFLLDPKTGFKKAESKPISGQSQNAAGGCLFRDSNLRDKQDPHNPKGLIFPKLRAGLALTNNKDNKDDKGLILAFAANGEEPHKDKRANPHGFVIAYDTRGLLGKAGFSSDPAIFCTTSGNAWGGGIWQAGGAPVIDGDMIYVATSNGTSNNGGDDLAESMIKLQYLPSRSGKHPKLKKVDWYKAFLDEKTSKAGCLWQDNDTEVSCGRGDSLATGEFKLIPATDWDFGPSGPMMIPGSNVLLQGTKDGIIYPLNSHDLGKNDRFNKLLFQPPLVASYFSGDKEGETQQSWLRAEKLNHSIPCVDNWEISCPSVENPGPENGKTHHIHALALAQKDATGGIVYVWGENSTLKAYDFSTAPGQRPIFLAEGDDLSSKFTVLNGNLEDTKPPGGMPGGLLMVSSSPPSNIAANPFAINPDSAIVWAVYPLTGDANKHFADGQLIAYDATTFLPGQKLKRLYRTGDDKNGGLGTMTRMVPPVVANGKVYVLIYLVDGHDNVTGSQLKIYGLK
ncbi:MAG: hypothetical protein ACXWNC_08210 [Anaerolineales bacterium]